mmetsp:Transcript_16542/g.28121  ORF Transcript_16542/g.28121 Transcript_16542/m.28121 type:complete len:118 (-) Transcript_16542:965-1318(-)
MSQIYTKKNADLVKGQILMGSVLLRDKRSIGDDGKTHFDYPVPTLTLAGEKDGLLRLTRAVESYWHQHINIAADQAGKFPVIAMEGIAHSSFMDSSMLPSAVVNSDLKPEIGEREGH